MTTQFRLTKEESAVMDECRISSFWYRSIPLMAATTAFMTYRRLNNLMSPKFYVWKLSGGILGAYLVGKVSYVPECRKLILQRLPNSNLARLFESKSYELISDIAQPPEIVPKTATSNIFGIQNEQEEQQDDDFLSLEATDKNMSPRYVTYDELRQKNRAEHALKFSGTKVRNDTPSTNTSMNRSLQDNKQSFLSSPIRSNDPISHSTTTNRPKQTNIRRNQYGDEVYD